MRARASLAAMVLAATAAAVAITSCNDLLGNRAGHAYPDAASDASDDSVASDDDGGDAASPFTVVSGAPEGEVFSAIWGSDPQNIFVVGSNGVHYDFAGGSWTRSQPILGRDYWNLWGTSATDVYAVGTIASDGTGVVIHNDGTGWRDEYIAPTPLYGIWGTGSTSQDVVLATGAYGLIYGKRVGTTDWGNRVGDAGLAPNPDVDSSVDDPVLWSISGIDFGDFVIAGDRDRVFHWLGTDFEWLDPSVDRSLVFRTAWQAPVRQTSAFFGTNYLGVIWLSGQTFDAGTVLSDANLPNEHMYQVVLDQSQPGNDQRYVHGIWGTKTKVLFVGDTGRIYEYQAASGDIARVASPTAGALWGVWGSSPKDVWIVGERELVLHGGI